MVRRSEKEVTTRRFAAGGPHVRSFPMSPKISRRLKMPGLLVAMTFVSVSAVIAAPAVSFTGPTFYTVGQDPWNVVVRDLNGDGILDLATPLYGEGTVSVLLGNGNGFFTELPAYGVGTNPTWLMSGDFNGDQRVDLISVNYSSGSLSFLAGQGDGTFAPQTQQILSGYVIGGAVADFDNDGKLDLVIARYTSNVVSVLFGNGDGSFGREQMYPVGNFPYFIATGDFNNDGRPDFVVVNNESDTLSVLLNTGGHSFVAAPDHQLNGLRSAVVSVADLNRDGIQDLVVPVFSGSGNPAELQVLFGKGNGTFQLRNSYPLPNYCIGLDVGDFNGDGRLDVITANFYGKDISLFEGTGRGRLRLSGTYNARETTRAVVAADFNRDGKLDFVASTAYDPTQPFTSGTNLVVVLGQGKAR
jgi:hypothetical protein